jgi:pimeloyl-ACP methyl ester carboxylesterase
MLTAHRFWAEYNEGLTKLTGDENAKEVVIAKGCGHYIQVDDPKFVAKEIIKMIERVGW